MCVSERMEIPRCSFFRKVTPREQLTNAAHLQSRAHTSAPPLLNFWKRFLNLQNSPAKIVEHPTDSHCLGSHFFACENSPSGGYLEKQTRERHTKRDAKAGVVGEKGLSSATRAALARLNRRACSQATHCIAVYNWEGRGGGEGGDEGRRCFFVTVFSSRPLPHRFLFRPRFSFRAAEFLTLRTTKGKTH